MRSESEGSEAGGRLNLCLTLPRCVLSLRAQSPFSSLNINGSTMPRLVLNLSPATKLKPRPLLCHEGRLRTIPKEKTRVQGVIFSRRE